jgi:hypothetical protein
MQSATRIKDVAESRVDKVAMLLVLSWSNLGYRGGSIAPTFFLLFFELAVRRVVSATSGVALTLSLSCRPLSCVAACPAAAPRRSPGSLHCTRSSSITTGEKGSLEAWTVELAPPFGSWSLFHGKAHRYLRYTCTTSWRRHTLIIALFPLPALAIILWTPLIPLNDPKLGMRANIGFTVHFLVTFCLLLNCLGAGISARAGAHVRHADYTLARSPSWRPSTSGASTW